MSKQHVLAKKSQVGDLFRKAYSTKKTTHQVIQRELKSPINLEVT